MLHKYLYANDNPILYTDPSGYNAVRRGNDIHNLIGLDFITQAGYRISVPVNPRDGNGLFEESRVFDPRFPLSVIGIDAISTRNKPTVLRVIRTALGSPNHPGVTSINRKVPDLVDFNQKEIYEIKPNNFGEIRDATNKLTELENGLHSITRLSNWHRASGIYYTPPIFVVTSTAEIALTRQHSPGLIVYDVVNTRLTLAALRISANIVQQAIKEIIVAVISASARSGRAGGVQTA